MKCVKRQRGNSLRPHSVATSATLPRSARRRGALSWRWRPRHRAWHGEGRNSLRPRLHSVATSATLPRSARRRGRRRYGGCFRGDGALAIAHGTSGGVQFIAPTLSVATSATLPRDVRRRGAPLLRPLARLTAFGGYVATGTPSWRWRPRHRSLAATPPWVCGIMFAH